MGINYKKLMKLLIDKEITKTELRQKTGIGTATLAKLSSNEYVSLEVIEKICEVLQVQPGDIMEYVPDAKAGE